MLGPVYIVAMTVNVVLTSCEIYSTEVAAFSCKVSKLVLGEVEEVEVGVVNTHLASWYSETEAKWSQVMSKTTSDIFVTAIQAVPL